MLSLDSNAAVFQRPSCSKPFREKKLLFGQLLQCFISPNFRCFSVRNGTNVSLAFWLIPSLDGGGCQIHFIKLLGQQQAAFGYTYKVFCT